MTHPPDKSAQEHEADEIFRDYLDRLERGEALDLKALFSRHGPLENLLWERFWVWEEARTVFKADDQEDDAVASVVNDPELLFAFRHERGEEFGRRIGEFILLKEIGRGSMGVVFLARQEVTDRLVALKLLSPLRHKSPTARERFRREVTALGRLHNPYIVSILTAGNVEGIPFFAMELVCGVQMDEVLAGLKGRDPLTITGSTVHTIIETSIPEYLKPLAEKLSRAPLPDQARIFSRPYVEVACRFVINLAEALHHAHSQGVMHRDVKPSNVLVDINGTCRLSDFGLARELGTAALTKTGELVGTPYYAAPEQVAGRRAGLDWRADIYSLGVTLYELLCLSVPFTGESPQQVFHQILAKNPKPLSARHPGVPKELETIVFKCLEKDPDDRYQSAGELAEDLKAFLDFKPIRARPSGPVRNTVKLIRRHQMVAAALAVALVAVLVLAGYMLKVKWDAYAAELRVQNEVTRVVGEIRRALDASLLDEAENSVRRLQALDEGHPELGSLRKEISLLASSCQLKKAANLRQTHKILRERWSEGRAEIERLQRKIDTQHTTAEERANAIKQERDLRELELTIADMQVEILSALNNAESYARQAEEERHPAVLDAFAEHYRDRWFEGVTAGDAASAAHYAELVTRYDVAGRFAEELEGLAKLAISGTKGGTAYLFRYESSLEVNPNARLDRLVPTPSTGKPAAGAVRLARDFYPGDRCLMVHEGGISGLEAGDLIFEIDGSRSGGSLFVSFVAPGGPAHKNKVQPLHRIDFIENLEEITPHTWRYGSAGPVRSIRTSSGANTTRFLADGPGETLAERSGMEAKPAAELLRALVAPKTLTLTALHAGEEKLVTIREGTLLEIACEETAYPLVCSPQNAIGTVPFQSHVCAPGSYLAVIKQRGMEDLRLPFEVLRGRNVTLEAKLEPEGTSPEGFVRVDNGPFVCGGDNLALWPEERTNRHLLEFWICRREVTLREWYEFLNDVRGPDSTKGRLVPRYVDAERMRGDREASENYLAEWDRAWSPLYFTDPDTPVVGVSWEDISEFLKWKNEKAAKESPDWYFGLPTQYEWEKAARGVDGRSFPWGNRFDYTFCKSRFSHGREVVPRGPDFLRLEPAGSYPWDESPYGVRDLAGSVIEWNRDRFEDQYEVFSIRGGAYDGGQVALFRLASTDKFRGDTTAHNLGFRLVAKRSP